MSTLRPMFPARPHGSQASCSFIVWLLLLIALPALAQTGQTVVSLTFDDGNVDQFLARSSLQSHGLRATFYVNSGRLGLTGRLTVDQLRQLVADGHEVGGHTVNHLNLPTLDVDEQRRQICNDRVTLSNLGFGVTSFAYPFGALDSTTRQVVVDCGYNSGRDTGDLTYAGGCLGCPAAETLPPRDPFVLRTPSSVHTDTTLADLQRSVQLAEETGGGWVPLVFHHVCNGCDVQSITLADFEAFVAWLAGRAAQGTVVRTVAEVMGGELKPTVAGPAVSLGTDASQLLPNNGLEADTNNDGVPDCWQRGGFGTNTFSWSRTSDAHSGSSAQKLTITSLSNGDRKLLTLQDAGGCSPPAVPGHSYRLRAWYKGSSGTRLKAYYRTASGGWVYWTQGPLLPSTSSYALAEWNLPQVPAEAQALSVGLSLERTGSFTVDDLSLVDLSAAPTLTLSAPDGGESLTGGATFDIRWTSGGLSTGVDLAYSLDDGASWLPIGTEVANEGHYGWTVPEVTSTQVRVRVSASGRTDLSDTSDARLGIAPAPPALALLAPVGGEALVGGATFDIAWTSVSVSGPVDLDLSTDNGASWSPLAAGVPNSGHHDWTVPVARSTQARVRVRSSELPGVEDVSSQPFTLLDATSSLQAIPFHSVWRYEASGQDPGALWAAPGFDDSGWAAGPAELGYGDGDEATVLPQTSPSQTSVYFRRKVSVPGRVAAASLDVRIDDGVAVYVNGTLVFSRYIDRLAHAAYATATTENLLVSGIPLPPSAFVEGANTVAVMVKQVGRTSPDLSFDLRLTLEVGSTGP